MDFNLNDQQKLIQKLAYDFAEQDMKPYAHQWDEQFLFPKETLKKAAALGFAAICVDPVHQGSGMTRLDSALIFEQLSMACPSTAAYLSIHNMVAWLIDQYASESLKARWLPKLAMMDVFSSYCLTEPSSGSDAASLKTTAVRVGNEYELNGCKAFISGATQSDVYICMARTGQEEAAGISCFLIEKERAGLSFGKLENKLGWHSQPTAMVFLDHCLIPIENRIGKEGEGFKIALSALNGGRINIAACSLGGAYSALEYATHHLTQREQFNRKLSEFQALQFRLADMHTRLAAARLLVFHSANSFDTHHPDKILHCARAKQFATDQCFAICNDALQLLGGYGYLKDYPVERYFRDLRVHQILEGTNEIMQLIIARCLLQEHANLYT